MTNLTQEEDEKAKARRIAHEIMEKNEQGDRKKSVRQAGNTLYIVGALMVLGDFILILINPNILDGILIAVDAFILTAFIGLGILARKKPFPALLSGLILFLLILIIGAISDITLIYKGIIVKVIVISMLIKGISSARKLEPEKEKLTDENILDA